MVFLYHISGISPSFPLFFIKSRLKDDAFTFPFLLLNIKGVTVPILSATVTPVLIEWYRAHSRVLRKALPKGRSSGAREFHPHALTDPYVRLSPHTALIIQPTINGLPRPTDSSHCWLINQPKQDDPTPSLPLHYRDFIATMG